MSKSLEHCTFCVCFQTACRKRIFIISLMECMLLLVQCQYKNVHFPVTARKWRYDLRCGDNFPLPDGSPAECDPFGEKPCCGRDGTCGNSQEYCTCDSCTSYRPIKWRDDRRCGYGYPLPNGSPAECDPLGWTPCCSHYEYGWCGRTANHCFCQYCVDYRKKMWRDDKRCGYDHPLPDNSTTSECDPLGEFPCCSQRGMCGNTPGHCSCKGCIDYNARMWVRNDGRCGSKFLLPDGTPAQCDPNGERPCCDYADGQCYSGNCQQRMMIIRDIRESGYGCAFINMGRFLKHACFDEQTKNLYFKCAISGLNYEVKFADLSNGVSALCENDPYSYQVCGFDTELTHNMTGAVFCGGYFCAQKEGKNHRYIECSGVDCEPENRICTDLSRKTNSGPVSTVCSNDCSNIGVINGSIPLCNDNNHVHTDNECFMTKEGCIVHNRQMCDGHYDCKDKSDEIHRMCENQSTIATYRWNFRCPGNDKYLGIEKFCDGIESCGDNAENRVCDVAKDFPHIETIARNLNQRTRDVCVRNKDNRNERHKNWERRPSIFMHRIRKSSVANSLVSIMYF